MRVEIAFNNKTGIIQWSEESFKGAIVEFPEQSTADRVNEFLETARVFRIPKSQTIDNFAKVNACPNDRLDYLKLGLSELFAETGIRVKWPE